MEFILPFVRGTPTMNTDDRYQLLLATHLRELLTIYVQAGESDSKKWHDRVMTLNDATPLELARWHGQLLAADWIEQQTGNSPRWVPGEVPDCYRATPAGQRIIQASPN